MKAFRDCKPISARPPSSIDQYRKWTIRHQGIVAAVQAVSVVIAIAETLSSVLLRRETLRVKKQETRARVAERAARGSEQNAKAQAARAERAAATARGINRFLTDYVLAKADPSRQQAPSDETRSLNALADATSYVDSEFPNEPRLQQVLYQSIGQLHHKLG